MKVTVVGYEVKQGTSKVSGKPFKAYNLGCVYPFRKGVGEGQGVREIFIISNIFEDALKAIPGLMPEQIVGCDVQFEFNDRGYLDYFEVLGKAK